MAACQWRSQVPRKGVLEVLERRGRASPEGRRWLSGDLESALVHLEELGVCDFDAPEDFRGIFFAVVFVEIEGEELVAVAAVLDAGGVASGREGPVVDLCVEELLGGDEGESTGDEVEGGGVLVAF